jgi:hypothetical protein
MANPPAPAVETAVLADFATVKMKKISNNFYNYRALLGGLCFCFGSNNTKWCNFYPVLDKYFSQLYNKVFSY